MLDDVIFHPRSGEKGYFVSEKDAELIRAVFSDFRVSRMQLVLENQTVVGDAE